MLELMTEAVLKMARRLGLVLVWVVLVAGVTSLVDSCFHEAFGLVSAEFLISGAVGYMVRRLEFLDSFLGLLRDS